MSFKLVYLLIFVINFKIIITNFILIKLGFILKLRHLLQIIKIINY